MENKKPSTCRVTINNPGHPDVKKSTTFAWIDIDGVGALMFDDLDVMGDWIRRLKAKWNMKNEEQKRIRAEDQWRAQS